MGTLILMCQLWGWAEIIHGYLEIVWEGTASRMYGIQLCHDLQITPWQQGSWGLHGAHLGPTGPRSAPCWPRDPCYLGICNISQDMFKHFVLCFVLVSSKFLWDSCGLFPHTLQGCSVGTVVIIWLSHCQSKKPEVYWQNSFDTKPQQNTSKHNWYTYFLGCILNIIYLSCFDILWFAYCCWQCDSPLLLLRFSPHYFTTEFPKWFNNASEISVSVSSNKSCCQMAPDYYMNQYWLVISESLKNAI